MIFKRKVYAKLIEWKTLAAGTSAVLLEGARRIGKSTIVEEFAKKEYDDYMILDFARENQDVKNNFVENMNDLDTFFRNLFLLKGKSLKGKNCVIIFDEVQLFPQARQAIKYLVADGRYEYIETGSLISIRKNVKDILIPSEEYRIKMYPMDFEEYLWAKGYSNEQIEDLYQCMIKNEPLSKIQYDVMMENFQEYMIVGGMPLIVKTFVENKTYTGILEMQKQIILDYEEDITKYAGGLDKTKILNAYRKISVFLGNENKKFQITKISSVARNREYVGVI